jgi:hypothetical protein
MMGTTALETSSRTLAAERQLHLGEVCGILAPISAIIVILRVLGLV